MEAITKMQKDIDSLNKRTGRIIDRLNEIKGDVYKIQDAVDTRVSSSILLDYTDETPDSISILINAYIGEDGSYYQSNSSRTSWRLVLDVENNESRFERCDAGTSPIVWTVVSTLSAGGVWS